jgi:hypothetical protein
VPEKAVLRADVFVARDGTRFASAAEFLSHCKLQSPAVPRTGPGKRKKGRRSVPPSRAARNGGQRSVARALQSRVSAFFHVAKQRLFSSETGRTKPRPSGKPRPFAKATESAAASRPRERSCSPRRRALLVRSVLRRQLRHECRSLLRAHAHETLTSLREAVASDTHVAYACAVAARRLTAFKASTLAEASATILSVAVPL